MILCELNRHNFSVSAKYDFSANFEIHSKYVVFCLSHSSSLFCCSLYRFPHSCLPILLSRVLFYGWLSEDMLCIQSSTCFVFFQNNLSGFLLSIICCLQTSIPGSFIQEPHYVTYMRYTDLDTLYLRHENILLFWLG